MRRSIAIVALAVAGCRISEPQPAHSAQPVVSDAGRCALIRAYESSHARHEERPHDDIRIPIDDRALVWRGATANAQLFPWEQSPRWTPKDADFVPDEELKSNQQYLYCAPDGRAYRVKLLGLPYMTLFGGIKKYSWIPIDPDCTWGKFEWEYGNCRFKKIPETYPYTQDGWPLTRDNKPLPRGVVNEPN